MYFKAGPGHLSSENAPGSVSITCLAIAPPMYYSPPIRVDTLGGNADEAHREVPFRFTSCVYRTGKLSKQPRKDLP